MNPPARRWNDQAIDGLASEVRTFAPTVGTVAGLDADVEMMKERLNRFEDSRRTIVLGLLAFCGAIAAALISAAAVLVVHFTGG